MLQGFFLARDHFYICDKFVHGPIERHEVYLHGYLSRLVMRWLSLFLEQVFQRSRLNASAYSGILSPSTSGSGLLYPIPPCTSLYPVPARPTWPFQSPHGMRNSNPGIPGSHSTQLIKEQVFNLIIRPLCGAFTHRMVSTCWPIISFPKMILSGTLCASETFPIHSSATNTPKPSVPLSFRDQQTLYLVSFPLIVHLLLPRYNVSSIQQTSTFLWDCVSTTSQTSQSVCIECSHPEFPRALA